MASESEPKPCPPQEFDPETGQPRFAYGYGDERGYYVLSDIRPGHEADTYVRIDDPAIRAPVLDEWLVADAQKAWERWDNRKPHTGQAAAVDCAYMLRDILEALE